jgi:hypothetical protein
MNLHRPVSSLLSLGILWLCGLGAAASLGVGSAIAQGHRVGAFDFGYAVTGDARVLPVQVFDDGVHTYFQFRTGETMPAIFAHEGAQVRLLLPQPHGPFWRVPDRHGRFVLQSGRARAAVVHLGPDRPGAPAWTAESASGQPLVAMPAGSPAVARLVATLPHAIDPDDAMDRNSYAQPLRGDRAAWPSPVRNGRALVPVTPAVPMPAMPQPAALPVVGSVPAATVQAQPVEPPLPPLEFQVHLSDPSLRHVLVRWAQSAGWTHGPDHWVIDRDLPVVAPAGPEVFGADFREAVRRLLATSELTDRPLQPCFYSNRVLRVISRADTCSRSTEAG